MSAAKKGAKDGAMIRSEFWSWKAIRSSLGMTDGRFGAVQRAGAPDYLLISA